MRGLRSVSGDSFAGALEQSMGARNRVGIGIGYMGWWNRFLGIDYWAP